MKRGIFMNIIFGCMVLAEMFCMAICACKAFKSKDSQARFIALYESVVVICAVSVLGCYFVKNVNIAMLFRGIMLSCFDWFVMLLIFYTEYYTKVFRTHRIIKIILSLYCLADTILLISNPWNEIMFPVKDMMCDGIVYQFTQTGLLMRVHYIFNYVGILLVMLVFGIKTIRTSRFYRIRYKWIFASLVVANGINIMVAGTNLLFDVSVVAYGLMAILIYYYSLDYIPNELIENTLSLIIKDMNCGIICFDNNGRCLYINDILCDIYDNHINKGNAKDYYKIWMAKNDSLYSESFRFEIQLEICDDKRIYEVVYKKVYDEENNFICDYFIFNDRSAEIQSYEREKYRTTHDSLTGLYNRENFFLEVRELIERNPDVDYCMICSNIKDFKLINELFGIQKGDEILIKQARLMNDLVLSGGVYGRIQGDRYALCMPTRLIREQLILTSIQQMQKEFLDTSFHLHVMVGIYNIKDNGEAISSMVDKANIAAETIRNNYQRNIAYYDAKLFEKSVEERLIIGEFENAIENNRFVMYLQPQAAEDGTIYGAEALVRWEHPERGLLFPGAFIEVLEKTGLVYKLDMYIWDLAAKKLKEWKEIGREDLYISVNISARDFYFINIYQIFKNLIEKYEINPVNLKLEITETALMSDFEKNMKVIHKLQDFGFKIEIDDFGSGYSSLNMLKDISADVLKIDMGFLRQSENEAKGRDILESVINLAGKIGMEVITEGVETEEQLKMLTGMGCKMFQGYYFSKPISVREFEAKYSIQ